MPSRNRPSTQTASRTSRLSGMIRAIRAACNRLGIDDDERRAIVLDRTGRRSLSDCTPGELGRLLDHFNRDWRREAAPRPHIAKIRALWWSLYWLGAIHRPDDEALSSFVKRQGAAAHLRFVGAASAAVVIEALKAWLERENVHWWADEDVRSVAQESTAATAFSRANADRLAVLDALLSRLKARRVLEWPETYMMNAVSRSVETLPFQLTVVELDAAIRALGKAWRHHIDAGRLDSGDGDQH